jgi:hypothetical protein
MFKTALAFLTVFLMVGCSSRENASEAINLNLSDCTLNDVPISRIVAQVPYVGSPDDLDDSLGADVLRMLEGELTGKTRDVRDQSEAMRRMRGQHGIAGFGTHACFGPGMAECYAYSGISLALGEYSGPDSTYLYPPEPGNTFLGTIRPDLTGETTIDEVQARYGLENISEQIMVGGEPAFRFLKSYEICPGVVVEFRFDDQDQLFLLRISDDPSRWGGG